MIEFCPWGKTAIETLSALKQWMLTWLPKESIFLTPRDWFVRGHDMDGGTIDSNGFWRPTIKQGSYVWMPPPAASDACLEELRKARMKRKQSLHFLVIPKLMTTLWLRTFNRTVDCHFSVPATADHSFWPAASHEALYVGIVFPYLPFRPHQIRQTPKAVHMGRTLCKVFEEKGVDGGPVLLKFLREFGRLASMPPNVVWRMLYLGREPPFPRRLPGEGSKRRKRGGRKRKDGERVENQAQETNRLPCSKKRRSPHDSI